MTDQQILQTAKKIAAYVRTQLPANPRGHSACIVIDAVLECNTAWEIVRISDTVIGAFRSPLDCVDWEILTVSLFFRGLIALLKNDATSGFRGIPYAEIYSNCARVGGFNPCWITFG